MGNSEFLEASRVKLFDDTAVDGLSRHAKQSPNEHIFPFD